MTDALRDAVLAALRSHWMRARVIKLRAMVAMQEIETMAGGLKAGGLSSAEVLGYLPADPEAWFAEIGEVHWPHRQPGADEIEVPEWLS
jgi:hypothetical protein